MSKFELPIYNAATGKREKTLQRDFMPVNLFVRYQTFVEEMDENKTKSDKELFLSLKELFLETFPEMTEEEYLNQTDVGDVTLMFRRILEKSTQIGSGNSKNV